MHRQRSLFIDAQRARIYRRAGATAMAMVAAALVCGAWAPAWAQSGPDLNVLALDWARGRYLSPIICEVDGELVRGGRRVLVSAGPRHLRPPVNEVEFGDLDVDGATRCFNELGDAEPNVIGQVQIRLPGRPHPDTAQRDFAAALRRKRGFEFRTPAGHLRVQEVGKEETRDLAFRGGEARLTVLAPGSDDGRRLAGLRGIRKLMLELEANDGTLLRFPLLMTDPR